MIFKIKNSKQAFTLLEILLVVGIIAILAGIVIVAINPSKQIATVRNTQRLSDIKQINSALQQYYITNGSYPNSLLGDLTEICDTGDGTTNPTCTGLINLSVLVPTYLAAIPKDPLATTTAYTGYQVIKGSTSGLISLNAEHSELGQTIVLGKEAGGGGSGGNLVADCEGGGGIETTDGGDTICTFNSSGTFTVSSNIDVEVLVVAGGGGGGGNHGGGGGAGGVCYQENREVVAGDYSITVGSGGEGRTQWEGEGTVGGNSVFDTITALGGGKGGGHISQTVPTTGGSGAGGTSWEGLDIGALSIQTDSGGALCYGNAGGDATARTEWQGGGGGGAGSVGGNAGANGGNGGDGLSFAIAGAETYYGGGGGGGGNTSVEGTAGIGGLGGGGNGGRNETDLPTAGAPNTGGGGGGQRAPNQVPGAEAAAGGSGVVIIRYISI